MPKLRPPYPVERGFRGQPTIINNVETLASVPWIMRHGAAAFAALGTATSAGHQSVFALAGKDQSRRIDRSAHGHHHSRGRGGDRRRHPQRPAVQSRATRRTVRRLHPGAPGRYAHRLRCPGPDRRHHGFRRPGGARRPRLHGGYRALLPEIHAGRILRQVHLLPHRHEAHARDSGAAVRRPGPAAAISKNSKRWPIMWAAAASADWARPHPTRC